LHVNIFCLIVNVARKQMKVHTVYVSHLFYVKIYRIMQREEGSMLK